MIRVQNLYDFVDVQLADRGGDVACPPYELVSNMPVKAFRWV
jgi:hypothetical protein